MFFKSSTLTSSMPVAGDVRDKTDRKRSLRSNGAVRPCEWGRTYEYGERNGMNFLVGMSTRMCNFITKSRGPAYIKGIYGMMNAIFYNFL